MVAKFDLYSKGSIGANTQYLTDLGTTTSVSLVFSE